MIIIDVYVPYVSPKDTQEPGNYTDQFSMEDIATACGRLAPAALGLADSGPYEDGVIVRSHILRGEDYMDVDFCVAVTVSGTGHHPDNNTRHARQLSYALGQMWPKAHFTVGIEPSAIRWATTADGAGAMPSPALLTALKSTCHRGTI